MWDAWDDYEVDKGKGIPCIEVYVRCRTRTKSFYFCAASGPLDMLPDYQSLFFGWPRRRVATNVRFNNTWVESSI